MKNVCEILVVNVANMDQEEILSDQELSALSRSDLSDCFLAKRLAAKSALFNCLSRIGIYENDFRTLSVMNDYYGKPYFSFAQTLIEKLSGRGVQSVLLSISDEKYSACAYVVLVFK